MQNIKSLNYNRNLTHIAGQLLKAVTDEKARQWAREKWNGEYINYGWHPAIKAACEELKNENT